MKQPSRISRTINLKHAKRAASIDDSLVGPYLDTIAMELCQRLDFWRFHKGPVEDVNTTLDAFIALWTEANNRGLTP